MGVWVVRNDDMMSFSLSFNHSCTKQRIRLSAGNFNPEKWFITYLRQFEVFSSFYTDFENKHAQQHQIVCEVRRYLKFPVVLLYPPPSRGVRVAGSKGSSEQQSGVSLGCTTTVSA